MDIVNVNRILHALRTGTAVSSLSDADLLVIESQDDGVWPLVNFPPNHQERNPVTEKPWLEVYLPGITGVAGWSQVTEAIRDRRKSVAKVVAAPAVVAAAAAVQPDPEEAELARLQRESEEAEQRVRDLEARQAKTATPAPVAPPTPEPPQPPMPPRTEQPVTATGQRWNAVINDLRGLGSNGKLPTRATFTKWLERNGLDKLI